MSDVAFPCDQPNCDRTFTTPQALGKHKFSAHGIAGQGRGARQRRSRAVKSDDSLLIVLDVLCPKGFKAEHLPLVNDWLERTRKLLEAVRS